jgi:hypothetical protein
MVDSFAVFNLFVVGIELPNPATTDIAYFGPAVFGLLFAQTDIHKKEPETCEFSISTVIATGLWGDQGDYRGHCMVWCVSAVAHEQSADI